MAVREEKEKTRARVLTGFWLRAIGFVLVCSLILSYALYVMTPKNDYGICSMVYYYQQPQDTVDVLVLGTSQAYSGVNTAALWRDYGLAAYDLCGAEMPYWAVYYYLEEALKTQHPRLILLDAKPAIYAQPYSKKGRVIMSTYGIRSIVTRTASIIASTHPDNTASFAIGFPQVHGRYNEITTDDFRIPPDNGGRGSDWKGYMEMDAVDVFYPPTIVRPEEQKPLQEKQQYYFEKILKVARERGISLVLIGFPNPDYAYDHPYYNTVKNIAAEYGFPFWNYNLPGELNGLDYETHFADWQHLNTEGSLLFTSQLGERIRHEFEVPDRRGQEQWNSWQSDADRWFSEYENRKKAAEEDE